MINFEDLKVDNIYIISSFEVTKRQGWFSDDMKKYLKCPCKMIKHHSSVKEAISVESLLHNRQIYVHYQDLEKIEETTINTKIETFDINNLNI